MTDLISVFFSRSCTPTS